MLQSSDKSGVQGLMQEYEQEMGEPVRGTAKLTPKGFTYVGTPLTKDEAAALMHGALPGLTGQAQEDFSRILNSDWGKQNISAAKRSALLSEINRGQGAPQAK